MYRDRVDVFQQPGGEDRFEELPGEGGGAGRDDHGLGVGRADSLGGGQREFRVILSIGLGLPEPDIGLVPDFPDDALAAKVLRGGRGVAGEGGPGLLRMRGLSAVVEPIAVIEDEDRPGTGLFEVPHQPFVGREVIVATVAFDAPPGEVHPHEPVSRLGEPGHLTRSGIREVNVDAEALRNNRPGQAVFRGIERGGQCGRQKDHPESVIEHIAISRPVRSSV